MRDQYQKGKRSDATATTSKDLGDLALRYLNFLKKKVNENPNEILALWSKVVSPQHARMTKAVKFEEGVLFVSVNNSTLLTMLHTSNEKQRLLTLLQGKVPKVAGITFFFG